MKQGAKNQSVCHLIVDGYNVIGAWDEIREIASKDLESARVRLADILLDYCGYMGQILILVFDAHNTLQKQRIIPLTQAGEHCVVFTQRGQTADNYIERYVRDHNGQMMTVASSDALVQVMVLAHASRLSSRELKEAVDNCRQNAEKEWQDAKKNKLGLGKALNEDTLKALNALRFD